MPHVDHLEAEKLAGKKNPTSLPFDPGVPLTRSWKGSILDRFTCHALRQPKAVAVVSAQAALTYLELDAASDALAEQSKKHLGDSQGERILSVYGDRNARLTVALLAAIKSGCAFHVIDPKYPLRRIADYLNYLRPAGIFNASPDSSARVSLSDFLKTQGSFWLDVPLSPKQTVGRANGDAVVGATTIAADTPLYIAFTSGTTGIPKAVWGSHGPVSHFFDWQCRTFNIAVADRVSVLSGLAHDPLLRDVLMPLWAGGAACFPPDDVYRVPGLLYSWLRDVQVTIVHMTPSLCHLLLNIPQSELTPSLPQIRLAFFGGEPLTYKLAARFQALAPNAVVVNCYGATETPQVMSIHVIESQSANLASVNANGPLQVPIGRGIEGVQLLVLTGNRLCGVGEMGEICVRTPYRASRVEDINGRTSAYFVPNPFLSDPNDLLYRTGDYGHYLADGAVVLLGRRDQQIKVRGFRVDLSEIEFALEKCPGITRSVVDAQPQGDDHALALFVVPKQLAGFEVDALRMPKASFWLES